MSVASSRAAWPAKTSGFGQVMGLVAVTLGLFTLGAYLGRHLAGWSAIVCPPGYRVLFWLLLALIVFVLVSLFASMPGGNVLYAVLGLVVFGGYTRR